MTDGENFRILRDRRRTCFYFDRPNSLDELPLDQIARMFGRQALETG